MNRKYGALSSSEDPSKLSATVSGAILAFSSLIIMGAGWAGFPLAESQIGLFAQQTGMAVGSLWFLWGVIRKIIVHFAKTE